MTRCSKSIPPSCAGSALLGAAAGYVYASLDAERSRTLLPFYTSQSEIRLAQLFQQAQQGWKTRTWMPAPHGTRRVTCCGRASSASWRRCLPCCSLPAPNPHESVPGESSRRSGSHFQFLDRQSSQSSRSTGSRSRKQSGRETAAARKIPLRVGDFGPLTYQNDDVLKARLAPERVAKDQVAEQRGHAIA